MLLDAEAWGALLLSIKLASLTVVILLVLATPLAWWMARSKARYIFVLEALVALPLVLPPTVLGFYLLIALAPEGPIGTLVHSLGGPQLIFSFVGLVIGSAIYSLPFVVQPLQNAFATIPRDDLEVATMLNASPLDRFFNVALPLARPGVITAIVLGFSHTLGEFGVVLMIGGSIPNETEVVSITIYNYVEGLQYQSAHALSAILLSFSFILLLAVYAYHQSKRRFGDERRVF